MKHCINCQAELEDDAMFCGNCGHPQPGAEEGKIDAPNVEPQPVPQPQPEVQHVQAPSPQQPQGGPPPVPMQPQPVPPPPPKPPTELQLDGKRYFKWLSAGLLGTIEPIHGLLAAIVPFLITLFNTLAVTRSMMWHAGGFFLVWFINIVVMAVLPIIAWVLKKHYVKDDVSLKDVFSQYSSYHNIVFLISFVVMIFGMAIPFAAASGFAQIFWLLGRLMPMFSLLAALNCLLVARDDARVKKAWSVTLIMVAVFYVLFYLMHGITYAGMKWGARKFLGGFGFDW